MRTTRIIAGTIFALLLLAGCASHEGLVKERLDSGTGVTVLRATNPLILYRDNSAYAAHARDYVYMGPIEVNSMGDRSYYLWLGIWSTVSDADRLSHQRNGFESVVVFADGEPLPLEFAGWTLDAIGASQPVYLKPVASAADGYYRVTLDQVRVIASARDVELRAGIGRAQTYELWDIQSPASASLREFVDRGRDYR